MAEIADEKKKRVEERMKTLDAFGSIVAHDLRNPLSGIRGFANLLEKELGDNPKLREMASLIVKGADDLNRLLTDILEFARPHDPETVQFDLIEVIKKEMENIEEERWNLMLPSDSFPVETDRKMVEGLIRNLLLYAENIGEFKLSLNDGSEIDLLLEIFGRTLNDRELEKVFYPHFSSNGPLLQENLSLAKRNIDCLMGEVEVNSQEEKGIEIRIKLPRCHGY